ncbi:MAG: hypothetical protein OGM18_00480 [Oscillospiraceae bacterium]|nr:MAG: hypothetical protein OGM18_00480 [Oscillospiraceae bacterium]
MDLRNCTKQELSQMPYEYVREAYYQHNPNAVWILGVFFRHGKNGAPQNYEKARQLLEIAYEYEGAGSGFILGNIYEEGLGTTVDLKKQKIIIVHFLKKRMIQPDTQPQLFYI